VTGVQTCALPIYLKLKVKRAVSYVSDFESAVAREARKRGADGVVCGHIHHAEIREIEGILYCNDGDWVESLTALVEHMDGRLEIIDRGFERLPVIVAAARASIAHPVADAAGAAVPAARQFDLTTPG
jgi:hypothetical protein